MLLNRDTRDTLFLLGVIGWLLLLQSPNVPLWCSVLGATVLLWRGWQAWRQRALPGWPWRLGLLVATVAGTWWSHRSLLGQDAGVTLVTVLLALKTLELRAQRDAMVVFYLGFFTLVTHFLYSQSLLTALGITLGLWGLLTALVQAHKPLGRAPLWHSARLAAGMALLGSPIMLVLFVLFPRLPPLWAMPDTQTQARSGLSADMEVGQVAQLALDSSIAFRVTFSGPAPAQNQLYFRGPVLSLFDGRRWTPDPANNPKGTLPPVQVQGAPIDYQVTLEAHQRHWLLTLDATPQAPRISGTEQRKGHGSPALQWLTERPVTELLRYQAQAYTQYQLDPRANPKQLKAAQQLPPHNNPRTRAWAQTLRERVGPQPQALVQASLQHLRTGGYVYTLTPGLFGQHTADEFWFDKKAGFCEHIASSFVVLMRALDIPARVVTGYQGGEFNTNGGFWTVRQSDAHAWAEVWLSGQGWRRIDPTAYVAPDRASSLLRLNPPEGAWLGTLRHVSPELLTQMRLLWDATNHRWNQWVLNHEQQRQLQWLEQLGWNNPSLSDLFSVLLAALGAMALLATATAWWLGRQRHPWLALLQQAQHRMRQAAWQVPQHTTPRLLQQVLQQSALNASTLTLQQWLLDLESCRYDPNSPHTLRSLRQRWRQLQWPHAPTSE